MSGKHPHGIASVSTVGALVSWTQPSDLLTARYGYFETRNSYFTCNDPTTIDAIFAHLRHYVGTSSSPQATWRSPSGAAYPGSIGTLPIKSVRDLTSPFNYDSRFAPSYEPDLPVSTGHMITFRAGSVKENGVAITLTIR